ncbi:hypothetical protein Bca52824_072862 [Brassica carinata]|uniref:Uncharacterized protein n=1 Tax=Brassica carinata TaxID=52824 RepID=A0A8X7Q9Y9_BRACI|nr:hypothetical protein Bca52824_072862 [Brassica carinata]
MKGNKKISSIFDYCHETASQEIFLRSCGFAQRGVPPDSDPSVLGDSPSPPSNDGTAPRRDSETDSVINSRYEEELVESHAVRFVSPPESPDTVDSEEDRTAPVDPIPLEKPANLLPSSSRSESPAKKLKIPLRDVVKAIVMNSRRTDEEEEDREVAKKKTSCVQILINKGFIFP